MFRRLDKIGLIGALCLMFTGIVIATDGTGTITDPNSNCKVVQGEYEYDLSELASRDYWYVHETLHTGKDKEYYLSVCHPLINAPGSCTSGNTGVCSKTIPSDESITPEYRNMGNIPTKITVADVKRIEYIYDSGIKCPERGGSTNYTTELHLICDHHGDSMSGPTRMSSSSSCSLFFAWMTPAACPKKLEKFNATTCTVKFSNSDHILNLHTLHSSSYYNVSSSNSIYELNICGPVTNGHCGQEDATMCKVIDGASPVVMGTTKDMNLVWHENHLDLIYNHNDMKTEIKFYCDRTATAPQIYYVHKINESEIFSVKTSAVCSPDIPQCVISDHKGNVFDLRPLHMTRGNYDIVGTRNNQQVLYHINVCGEVNDEHDYYCPPGPIGACQVSVGADASYNLGFLTSDPVVNNDGSITILYSGGDICKEGPHTRSTRINLFCDTNERDPVLFDVSDTCEYIFNWRTPAACPKHETEGDNCQVVDPLYGYEYNLTSLRNRVEDYNYTIGDHSYLVNLCGPLMSKCNGEEPSSSGVCQIGRTHQYSGGLASSHVTFKDGTLLMEFTQGSDECKGNKTRSSQIIFLCNQDASGFDGPVFTHEYDCTYYFLWHTKEACPPFSVVDCSYITRNGTVYDLSELSSSLSNEEYFSRSNGNRKFVLNVCRSVVHSKESRCPYKAAACIVDVDHKAPSLNIGEVSSGPIFENGRLKLKYQNGDVCETNNTMKMETIIEFVCDKDELYPYPQLMVEENCRYIFEWSTPIACPLNNPSTTTSGIPKGSDCGVVNPSTGHHFDLKTLKKSEGYEILGDNDLHLRINVCQNVKGKCSDGNTGACSYTHDNEGVNNAGVANDNLYFLPGFLFLHYTGGDKCQNAQQRSTLINFICGAEGTEDGPVLIYDDLNACTYHINWYTFLACERRINCYVDTWERRIDLSPLTKTVNNYETVNPQNPKQKFYLNICRPLNPINGLLCHPGSAACLDDSVSESPLNLGHPTVTPINAYDDGVQLMYSAGSVCPSNPKLPVTSKIIFKCDESAGLGNPVFMKVTHDCQYLFEWNTSLVCKEETVHPSGPVCQIMYKEAKTNVDLRPLQKPEGYQVKFGNTNFKINVCGPMCGDSGVCTTNGEHYGMYTNSMLKWDYDKLMLVYYGGDTCDGSLSGKTTSHIFFKCDMSAGYGHPVVNDIMFDSSCVAVFDWKTNVTCVEGIYSTDDTPPADNTTPSGSTPAPSSDTQKSEGDGEPQHSTIVTVVASIMVVSGIIFVIVLVLLKSQRGQLAVASVRRLFGFTGYTDLRRRQNENSNLLDPTSRVFRVDDSDDDLLRV